MKSKREESFKKIQGESFYTSPPYNYRPSIAEYLTSLDVTKKGFIADIMHLDYKGNIKLTYIKEDFFNLKLIDDKELNFSERFIWDYLKSLEKNKDKDITLDIKNISKSVLSQFSALVRVKTGEKFNSGSPRLGRVGTQYNSENLAGYRTSLFLSRIFTGIFLSFIGFLSLIAIIVGLSKLARQKSDVKFFFRKFVSRYFIISLIYYPVTLIFLFLALASIGEISPLLFPLALIFGIIWIIIFYNYSKLAYDYISWLFESKEASEHREEWMKFKSFVINNSEIEKQPLGHYTLWGPFYYYTLAVGGMNKEI